MFKIFLIKINNLVLFISIIGKKLISTRYISKKSMGRLIFLKVFNIKQKILIFLFGQFITSKIFNINFLHFKW